MAVVRVVAVFRANFMRVLVFGIVFGAAVLGVVGLRVVGFRAVVCRVVVCLGGCL